MGPRPAPCQLCAAASYFPLQISQFPHRLPSGTSGRHARDSLWRRNWLAVAAALGVRICSNTSPANVELTNSSWVSVLGQCCEDPWALPSLRAPYTVCLQPSWLLQTRAGAGADLGAPPPSGLIVPGACRLCSVEGRGDGDMGTGLGHGGGVE